MKINSINSIKTYNLVSFKAGQKKENVSYEKTLSTTVPVDTTQFKSSIKKTEPSILKKVGSAFINFFNEPYYTPGFDELIATSPYIF